MNNTKCEKCNCPSHCRDECQECPNDVCTGCRCENCK
jgi:hypothetical protein